MHVSLHTRLIILIASVLIYLHYMHYILSLRTVTLNLPALNKYYYNTSYVEATSTNNVNLRYGNTTQKPHQQSHLLSPPKVLIEESVNNKYIATIEILDPPPPVSSAPSPSTNSPSIQPSSSPTSDPTTLKIMTAEISKIIKLPVTTTTSYSSSSTTAKSAKGTINSTIEIKAIPQQTNSITTNSTIKQKEENKGSSERTHHWNKGKSPNAKFSKLKETISQHAKPHEMINPDNLQQMTVDHPHHSPRNGTFIEFDYFQLMNDHPVRLNAMGNHKKGDDEGDLDSMAVNLDDDDDADDDAISNTTTTVKPNQKVQEFHDAVDNDGVDDDADDDANNGYEAKAAVEAEAEVMKLLSCVDQHDCITPSLQLQVKMNVYLCKRPKDGGGVRFYFLIKQGLLLHPNVNLITDLDVDQDIVRFEEGVYNAKNSNNSNNNSDSRVSDFNSTENSSMLSSSSSVDYLFYLPGSLTSWDQSECGGISTHPTYSKQKLIVLEEFDGLSPLFSPYGSYAKMKQMYGESLRYYNMYFKRSFVNRYDGKFKGYPLIDAIQSSNKMKSSSSSSSSFLSNNITNQTVKVDNVLKLAWITAATQKDIYPLTYPIAEDYIPAAYNVHTHREISILCTLRGSKNSSSPMSTRIRTQEWVTEYTRSRNLTHSSITEPLNMATRTALNKAYFEHMHNAKIIVTVNPADWEGDFRLWESLASGALVFVDPLFVPHPYPLLDGVHLVYFSNHNKTELWTKLDYYLSHPLVMQQVARRGYLYAMKHHRAVNLIDYILCSAHLKRVVSSIINNKDSSSNINNNSTTTKQHQNKTVSIPPYVYTAQYLNAEAKRQERRMILHQLPGVYRPLADMY